MSETTTREPVQRFRYRAQTTDGAELSGTLESADGAAARQRLSGMGLRVLELHEADTAEARSRPAPLRAEDVQALNEQLARLTEAGLPLERGLRLIAGDMPGRRSMAIRRIADRLERGDSIEQAFDAESGNFPPLYGRILEAGLRIGNPHGVLLNLGRQFELVERMRSTLWRTLTYPALVLVGVLGLIAFIGAWIVPTMREMLDQFDAPLPWITRVLFAISDWMAPVAITLGVLAIVGLIGSRWLIWRGRRMGGLEWFFHVIPLIGPALKRGLTARWCGALKLAVEAGLDLPTALRMAGQASGSKAMTRDSEELATTAERGEPLAIATPVRRVPRLVRASIDLAAARGNLPDTLHGLTAMFESQADHRLAVLRIAMLPIVLLILAGLIGTVLVALFLPLPTLIQSVTY